jgi:hypothetical protein
MGEINDGHNAFPVGNVVVYIDNFSFHVLLDVGRVAAAIKINDVYNALPV